MTMNLARLIPDYDALTLMRIVPQVGFDPDHADSLFLVAEQLGTLNCLRMTGVCLVMLCRNEHESLNAFVPPSVKAMEGIDVATDSTPLLIAGSGKGKTTKYNIEQQLRSHLNWAKDYAGEGTALGAWLDTLEINVPDPSYGGEELAQLTTRIKDFVGQRVREEGSAGPSSDSKFAPLSGKISRRRGLCVLWCGIDKRLNVDTAGLSEKMLREITDFSPQIYSINLASARIGLDRVGFPTKDGLGMVKTLRTSIKQGSEWHSSADWDLQTKMISEIAIVFMNIALHVGRTQVREMLDVCSPCEMTISCLGGQKWPASETSTRRSSVWPFLLCHRSRVRLYPFP